MAKAADSLTNFFFSRRFVYFLHHFHNVTAILPCANLFSVLWIRGTRICFPIYSQLMLFIFAFFHYSNPVRGVTFSYASYDFQYRAVYSLMLILSLHYVSLSVVFFSSAFVRLVLQLSTITTFISLLNFQLTNMSLQLRPIIFNPRIIYGDKLDLALYYSPSVSGAVNRVVCVFFFSSSLCFCLFSFLFRCASLFMRTISYRKSAVRAEIQCIEYNIKPPHANLSSLSCAMNRNCHS